MHILTLCYVDLVMLLLHQASYNLALTLATIIDLENQWCRFFILVYV